MRVDPPRSQPVASQPERVDALREKLQLALLKKSLEAQQESAAEILRQAEGKGSVIDIRV